MNERIESESAAGEEGDEHESDSAVSSYQFTLRGLFKFVLVTGVVLGVGRLGYEGVQYLVKRREALDNLSYDKTEFGHVHTTSHEDMLTYVKFEQMDRATLERYFEQYGRYSLCIRSFHIRHANFQPEDVVFLAEHLPSSQMIILQHGAEEWTAEDLKPLLQFERRIEPALRDIYLDQRHFTLSRNGITVEPYTERLYPIDSTCHVCTPDEELQKIRDQQKNVHEEQE